MPDSKPWSRWLPRLAVESIVVVFSILLALVVNEWRQGEERERRQARATAAIRAELLNNYREVREAYAYNGRLADTLFALSAAGVESVRDPGVRPEGWVHSADLPSAAWAAARSTGTTSQLRYPVLLALSRAYEEQATYRRRSADISTTLLSGTLTRQSPSLGDHPGGMAAILNNLTDWERQLLHEYDRALEALGVPADSIAPDRATSGASTASN